MKSRSYLLLSIDFIKLPQFVNLIPDSIKLYKEVAESINALNKMIIDINQSIEAYNLFPIELPPNVKVAIDNKCEIDREYIYVLNNLSESTINLLKNLATRNQRFIIYFARYLRLRLSTFSIHK